LILYILLFYCLAGGTKRCRLSWLTKSALVNEPKCGGRGGSGVLANKYSCAHRAPKNFGDLQCNAMFNQCCLATCQLKHFYPDFSRPFSLLPSLCRQLATMFCCHPRVIILSSFQSVLIPTHDLFVILLRVSLYLHLLTFLVQLVSSIHPQLIVNLLFHLFTVFFV